MEELWSKDYGYKKVFVYRLNKPLKFPNSEEIQKKFYIKTWKSYDSKFHKLTDLSSKHCLEILNYFWRKKVNNDLEYFDTILIEQHKGWVRFVIVYWLEDIKKVVTIGSYIGGSCHLEHLKNEGY